MYYDLVLLFGLRGFCGGLFGFVWRLRLNDVRYLFVIGFVLIYCLFLFDGWVVYLFDSWV